MNWRSKELLGGCNIAQQPSATSSPNTGSTRHATGRRHSPTQQQNWQAQGTSEQTQAIGSVEFAEQIALPGEGPDGDGAGFLVRRDTGCPSPLAVAQLSNKEVPSRLAVRKSTAMTRLFLVCFFIVCAENSSNSGTRSIVRVCVSESRQRSYDSRETRTMPQRQTPGALSFSGHRLAWPGSP